jgi:hypothetical protein
VVKRVRLVLKVQRGVKVTLVRLVKTVMMAQLAQRGSVVFQE